MSAGSAACTRSCHHKEGRQCCLFNEAAGNNLGAAVYFRAISANHRISDYRYFLVVAFLLGEKYSKDFFIGVNVVREFLRAVCVRVISRLRRLDSSVEPNDW